MASSSTGVDTGANSSGLRQTQAGSTPDTAGSQTLNLPAPQADISQSAPHTPVRSKYRHVTAIHAESRPSCLSHDSTAAPSFLGFRNLMVIVLVASNLRLMIENMQKYGVLICIRCHDIRHSDVLWGLGLYMMIPASLFIAYLIELLAANQARGLKQRYSISRQEGTQEPPQEEQKRFRRTWITIAWIHMLNISAALGVTTYVVYYRIHHPLIGTLNELHAVIVWLKTISYFFTNRDLRHAYLHPAKGELERVPALYDSCPYPENITMGNLCYFWWAPTLVYQPAYPRTPSIRWIFVGKRVGEVFIMSVAIWLLTAQYATPTLINSLSTMHTMNVTSFIERLLKLSTISLVIWLCGFFALFQSFLNALAEVMRFGDRSFYDDWWNAPSLGEYWRTWNKPVYQFFKRHLYSPMRHRGWSNWVASTTVFCASAVLHEILVGVPTHNVIGAAFFGMMFQLVLIHMTKRFERDDASHITGNCIFWLFFTIIGQPMAVLIYFYAWQSKYGSVAKDLAHLGAEENLAMKKLLPGYQPRR